MKFTGDGLDVKWLDGVALLGAEYDEFSKDVGVGVCDGWTAIIVQDGKFVTSIDKWFKVKDLKKYGVKVPLFGGVKVNIWFARKTIKNSNVRTEPKQIDCAGGKHNLTCKFSYEIELTDPSKIAGLALQLKLKPNENGAMLGFGDLNYVTDVVVGQHVKPGTYHPRKWLPDAEIKFELDLRIAYEDHVFPAFGYTCNSLDIKEYDII